jgi:hypothetical protein
VDSADRAGSTVQRVGQGKDDVEVGYAEQILFAPYEPALPRLCLALGTVAVATGNGELSITCSSHRSRRLTSRHFSSLLVSKEEIALEQRPNPFSLQCSMRHEFR